MQPTLVGRAIYTIVIYVMLDRFLKLLVVLLVIDHLSSMRAHVYFNIDLSSTIAHHMFLCRLRVDIFDTRRLKKHVVVVCVRALMIKS